MSTTLDDILTSTQVPGPVQFEDGSAEDLGSYGRRLIRQGLILGAQWGIGQVPSQAVLVHLPRDVTPHTHEEEQPPAEPAALRTDEQSRTIFACLNDLGFDTHNDPDGARAFVNAVLGEGNHVESTKHLTVKSASRIISVLVTLPAVKEARAKYQQ